MYSIFFLSHTIISIQCQYCSGCFQVPGAEGRAGMAAILDTNESLNLEQLNAGVVKSLASYARPLFVRTAKELEMTGKYSTQVFDNTKAMVKLDTV